MDADKIVRDFCAAWDRTDLEAIMEAFAENAVYHNIPMAACNGKEEIRQFIAGLLGGMASSSSRGGTTTYSSISTVGVRRRGGSEVWRWGGDSASGIYLHLLLFGMPPSGAECGRPPRGKTLVAHLHQDVHGRS